MVTTKAAHILSAIVCAIVIHTRGESWAMYPSALDPAGEAAELPRPIEKAKPQAAPAQAIPAVQQITRTARGTVRDEQGRPVAQAWVGREVRRSYDYWPIVWPVARIRERSRQFRDQQGKAVPPGKIGRYFEFRDDDGKWLPIDPADIAIYHPSHRMGWGLADQSNIDSAFPNEKKLHEIRLDKGRLEMSRFEPFESDLSSGPLPADRTDADGRFEVELSYYANSPIRKIHFASRDFTHQELLVFDGEDLEKPQAITLKTCRLVRARLVETPMDNPSASLKWTVYTRDKARGRLDYVDVIGLEAVEWTHGSCDNPNAGDTPDERRRFEAYLPAGRYRLLFESDTVKRVVDLTVPAGNGPLELPDIHLESLAWAKMVGKLAAEIEATDVAGSPVKLADHRGNVVVLSFWTTDRNIDAPSVVDLAEIAKRTSEKPIVMLALHDVSVHSLERYKNALAPLRKEVEGEVSIQFLLDRCSTRDPGASLPRNVHQELTSGRTTDRYELIQPATFIIDTNGVLVYARLEKSSEGTSYVPGQNGRLVGDFSRRDFQNAGQTDRSFRIEALVKALEDLVGLPRSQQVKPAPKINEPPPAATGHVVVGEKPQTTSRAVTVIGRMVRAGKPIAGVTIVLREAGQHPYIPHGDVETRTDNQGNFRFFTRSPDNEFWVSAKLGTVPNQGAVMPLIVHTGKDGSTTDAGEFHVQAGRMLSGRIVCSDGKSPPAGMNLVAGCANVAGLLVREVDNSGRFQFEGIPDGPISVTVFASGIRGKPAGYRLSPKNKCFDPISLMRLEGRIDRDTGDLTILLEPGEQPDFLTNMGKRRMDTRGRLDPAVAADFLDAKAGPITGVAPGDYPPR